MDLDGYSVKGADGMIADTSSDSMDVFSIPLGVTLSKDFSAGAWQLKPVLDLTVFVKLLVGILLASLCFSTNAKFFSLRFLSFKRLFSNQ